MACFEIILEKYKCIHLYTPFSPKSNYNRTRRADATEKPNRKSPEAVPVQAQRRANSFHAGKHGF
jgi:hypothetical protein